MPRSFWVIPVERPSTVKVVLQVFETKFIPYIAKEINNIEKCNGTAPSFVRGWKQGLLNNYNEVQGNRHDVAVLHGCLSVSTPTVRWPVRIRVHPICLGIWVSVTVVGARGRIGTSLKGSSLLQELGIRRSRCGRVGGAGREAHPGGIHILPRSR